MPPNNFILACPFYVHLSKPESLASVTLPLTTYRQSVTRSYHANLPPIDSPHPYTPFPISTVYYLDILDN